ncbi:MAG: oligogalacturonate lyase family protein [Planctomycetes bacterium]|nr:oligogalacturonate lyase family protein [Planctomycetota bacterium]
MAPTATLTDSPTIPGTSVTLGPVRTFTDENTGRAIRQLTDLPNGAHLSYFRYFKQLPGNRILARGKHEQGNMIILHPESGEVQLIPHALGTLKLRESDGFMWIVRSAAGETKKRADRRHDRSIWTARIEMDGSIAEPALLAEVPDDLPGDITDITIDGRYLLTIDTVQDITKHPIPTTRDIASIRGFYDRPRSGAIWAYDLTTGERKKIHETDGMCPLHLDTSPADATLIRFCHDMYDSCGQRTWTIRADGSDLRKIRVQEYGELVTHEFWWADPNYIGYTYQDRRGEATLHDCPWAEYSPRPTQLGIADLHGREVFLSDPLESYHSHLYMSPDGGYVSGEGTHSHSFVYAAPFSMNQSRLDMRRMATIHTDYIPFRGQGVDCNFSADGRWLIYADKIGGSKHHQLFAVEVDF